MSDASFKTLALSSLIESDRNPRTHFDPAYLSELAENIKAVGVLQPILVRPLPARRVPDTDRAVTHEIIAGARRFRASRVAGLTTIPVMAVEMDDSAALEAAIVENLQREDLSALDEAEGYEALMKHSNLTADQVAEKIGKSRSYVYARTKLLDLQPAARDALREGKLDASKALLLARIPDPQLQQKALKDLTQANYHGDTISYRAAADLVQRTYMLKLADAKFPRKDETLVPAAGACQACPKRTGANPDLFADVKSADVCTDPKCYQAKEEAFATRQREEATARGQTIVDGREAKALMPNSWSNRVEGYLRLDDAADSPTDKPLRSLLAKQLVAEDVQPILVANPHKQGELVAVLPAEKVAELLKAKGDAKSADKVANASKASQEAEARAAKEEARRALEAAWRWAVLEATWVKVKEESANQSSGPKLDEITRHMALRHASGINQDNAKKLCKLLELGKVAPKDGLMDWVRTTTTPGAAMLLLLMFAEVEYQHWRDSAEDANKGLFLVAEAFGVDKAAIEAQTRANTRAAKASEKKPEKAKPATPSAAQASGVGGRKAKSPKTPAPTKPKTSPEEAMQGIAAAMRGVEGAADDGRADQGGKLMQDRDGADIEVGHRVQVVGDQLTDKWGKVVSIEAGNIAVQLDGLSSDYIFSADELKSHGDTALNPAAGWPFPKGHNTAVAA
jgi:ParB/RepB/Spo0J family partition protein